MTKEQLQKLDAMAKPRSEEAIKKAEERKKQRRDKDLLLKDLCARLPYGVICHIIGDNNAEIDDILTTSTINNLDEWDVKPYLRPLSSMTEEEKLMYEVLMLETDNVLLSRLSMTNEFCKKCSHYEECGFISRNLQYKCDILATFEEGYEQAIEKACKWLEQNPPMSFDGVRNYIENFRKAMEENNSYKN